MIRIAIVEDELRWHELIEEYLEKYASENSCRFKITKYMDGYEISENYPGCYDIIFMDIEMPLINGMEAAELIRKRDQQVVIIFITNMQQYAIKGYSVNALDYILKPISYYPFSQSLSKAMNIISSQKSEYITIAMKDGIEKVILSDLSWIESHGHSLIFHTKEKNLKTTVFSMKEMEQKLKEKGFCRCNSGYLVSLDKVNGIKNNSVLIENVVLPISRSRRISFMAALTDHITG